MRSMDLALVSSQECTRLSRKQELPSLDASHRRIREQVALDDGDAAAGDAAAGDDAAEGHRAVLGFLDRSSSNDHAFSRCSAADMDSVDDHPYCHLHHKHRHPVDRPSLYGGSRLAR